MLDIFRPVIQLSICSIFIVFFISGCGFEDCRKDSYYADKPGICGKIYRVEQAKILLNQKSIPLINVIFIVMLSPVLLLILFRAIRSVLEFLESVVIWLIKKFRKDPW